MATLRRPGRASGRAPARGRRTLAVSAICVAACGLHAELCVLGSRVHAARAVESGVVGVGTRRVEVAPARVGAPGSMHCIVRRGGRAERTVRGTQLAQILRLHEVKVVHSPSRPARAAIMHARAIEVEVLHAWGFGKVRFDSIRFDSIRFDSIILDVVGAPTCLIGGPAAMRGGDQSERPASTAEQRRRRRA